MKHCHKTKSHSFPVKVQLKCSLLICPSTCECTRLVVFVFPRLSVWSPKPHVGTLLHQDYFQWGFIWLPTCRHNFSAESYFTINWITNPFSDWQKFIAGMLYFRSREWLIHEGPWRLKISPHYSPFVVITLNTSSFIEAMVPRKQWKIESSVWSGVSSNVGRG